MTKKELSSLYFLIREIEIQQKRLAEMERISLCPSTVITGMPRCPGISDGVSRFSCEIHDLTRLIEQNVKRCLEERVRLEQYIHLIDDSEIRMIFTLRYINGLSFRQIAFSLGYQDESVPRKRHNRYLRRSEAKRKIAS
ncbi:MAG: hypothetical protein Q8878_05885 [Bacillota bacterium]|nr:hypothetical protein [Bacillota bacterium]